MKNRKGFALVELAIVIAIASTVLSAVLVGRHLIRQAQLRSVIAQVKEFQVAINAFKLQFDGAMPGDFTEATQYWGDITENGNGDNIIDETGWSDGNEGTRAWQHLVLAGILPADYLGEGKQKAGLTIPPSKVNGGGFYFRKRPLHLLHAGLDRPFIEWGLCNEETLQECHGGIITPEEGHFVDVKMDDGFATTGVVFGFNGYPHGKFAHCSGEWTSKPGTADYQMDYKDDLDCRMNFWLF